VIADGDIVFEGRVVPGTAYPFEAEDQIEVLVGSGAAIRIVYNGRDMGLLGSFGQVVNNIYLADDIITPTGIPSATPTITPTPTNTVPPTSTSRFTATPVLKSTPTQYLHPHAHTPHRSFVRGVTGGMIGTYSCQKIHFTLFPSVVQRTQ
jgi:hypothetical protein